MGIEKRMFERYPCSILGSCESGGNTSLGVKCYDVGADGAGLVSSERLSVGSHLRIKLCTKAENPLLVKGAVRWSRKDPDGWRAGVKFNKQSIFPLSMIV